MLLLLLRLCRYELRMQEGLTCGGGYLKLLLEPDHEDELDMEGDLSDPSKYAVMFGPDRCGANNRVHFIFRHQNPLSSEWEEKHMTDPPKIQEGTKSTLYTLIVRPDNSFTIKINGASVREGSLLEDFNPPVNPPAEIDDPEDKKPADWVDAAKIPDPNAVKPDDWDEDAPEYIVDEDAEKPDVRITFAASNDHFVRSKRIGQSHL